MIFSLSTCLYIENRTAQRISSIENMSQHGSLYLIQRCGHVTDVKTRKKVCLFQRKKNKLSAKNVGKEIDTYTGNSFEKVCLHVTFQ